MTMTPIGKFPIRHRPYNNITPFTYRDGLTYLEVLEGLRSWIYNTLIPHIDTEVGGLGDSWATEVQAVIDKFDASVAAIINETIEVTGPVVEGALKAPNSASAAYIRDTLIPAAVNAVVAAALPAFANGKFKPYYRDLASVDSGNVVNGQSHGRVLEMGPEAFDAGYCESPCVLNDPLTGRLAMLYTGYTVGQTEASHGLAYSDDGVNWEKWGQTLAGTGVSGDPDKAGVTGPVAVYEDGVFHLYYIGLDAPGYEGGTPRLCYATSPSLRGPWTRHGAIISPAGNGWRALKIWHANLVKRENTWYLFFNATGADGTERAGYATSNSLGGPWNVDDENSGDLFPLGHEGGIWGGDPFVYKDGEVWRAVYSSAYVEEGTGAWIAHGDFTSVTTDDEFPLGWSGAQQLTNFAIGEPFKPWIINYRGQTYHYGTGSGAIALVTQGQSTSVGKIARVDNTSGAPVVPVGAWGQLNGFTDLVVRARPGDIIECGASFLANNGGGDLNVDFVSRRNNANVSYWGGGSNGVLSMFRAGGAFAGVGGVIAKKVTEADIEHDGTLTVRILLKSPADRQVVATNDNIASWWVRNTSF